MAGLCYIMAEMEYLPAKNCIIMINIKTKQLYGRTYMRIVSYYAGDC